MAGRTFSGSTAEAGSAILPAAYWRIGIKLWGIYVKSFPTKLPDGQTALCHQFLCDDPKTITVKVDAKGKIDLVNGTEKSLDKFAVGALTGFEMALDALDAACDGAFKSFQRHDRVKIECTGITPGTRGQSDMPEFVVVVERR